MIRIFLASLILASPIADAKTTTRSASVRADFQRHHPCPANGNRRGPCPGYVVDHILPLMCGGRDSPGNMQWQTADEARRKDRIERNCKVLP